MRNFQTALDRAFSDSPAIADVPVVVTDTVAVRRPETRTTDVGKSSATWDWQDLRNYVVRQIEAKRGPFPRNPIKEKSIFSSFSTRWGALAGPIAEAAFEAFDGMWKGAPIAIERFCKGSDEFFAEEIARRLAKQD